MLRYRPWGLLSLTLLTWAGLAAASYAQVGGRIDRPFDRPTVSPYLNLFRGGEGSGAVLNYYGLVRPQLQAQQSNQQLGMNLQALQMQQSYLQQQGGLMPNFRPYSQLGITGHPTTFQSYAGASGGGLAGGGLGSVGSVGSVGGFPGIGGGGFSGPGIGGVGAAALSGVGGGYSGFGGGGLPGTGLGGVSGGGLSIGAGLPGYGAGSLTGHPAVFGAGGSANVGLGY